MGEPVVVRAGFLDKSCLHRLVHGIEQAVLRSALYGGEQLDVEVAANHSCHRQHLAGLCREASQTPPNHVANAFGHRHQSAVADHPAVVVAAHRPRFDQMAEHLPHEERVAFGLGVKGLDQLPAIVVELVTSRLRHQLGHLGHRQARHRELLNAG